METPQQPTEPIRQRRVRYSGTHPRRFHEKYKELNPDKYPDTINKVVASGKTPAGMHRPIMVGEILQVLAPKPGEIAVDCTLGFGAHASEILRAIRPGGKLIAVDTDPIEIGKTEARLRNDGFSADELIVRNTNFAALPKVLAELDLAGVDLLLADLGVSSMQLDDPARGFTFKQDGPLDLRLNPTKGLPAADYLAKTTVQDLANALHQFSDEPRAEIIARAIVETRPRSTGSTRALAETIRTALRESGLRLRTEEQDAAIRRTFQALRIAVNDEFGTLENLLRFLPFCLNKGGRAAFLTFHSGEDRRVKKSFQEGHRTGIFAQIAGEPIRASAEEIRSNPRASSAKLRWAVRAP
jgi:16S rRNA (cytosine1402-N4)-methyltransferase